MRLDVVGREQEADIVIAGAHPCVIHAPRAEPAPLVFDLDDTPTLLDHLTAVYDARVARLDRILTNLDKGRPASWGALPPDAFETLLTCNLLQGLETNSWV